MRKFWKFISNIGVELESDEINKQQIKLLNQFTLIVCVVFLLHSIQNFFFLDDFHSGRALLIMSLFFITTLFYPLKKLRRITSLVAMVFILICLVIFYYESYSGKESGIFLYYFPLALAIPFVFNFDTDKIYIIIIIAFILLAILINARTDYSLFNTYARTDEVRRKVFFVALSISTIIVFVDLFFLFKKNQMLTELYKSTLEKELLLKEKDKQLEASLSTPNEEEINAAKLHELTQLAINNDSSFFPAFQKFYPNFCPDLLKKAPDLSISELELCAFIKLNFTTKDIARYTSISIRAVEGRKFRIRKKLHIGSEKELVAWMMKSDLAENA